MQETENAVETSHLIEVRRRRVGLRHTMTAVEEAASSALAGRATEGRQRLLTQVDDLRAAWASHVTGTEGPGGLWEQIRTDAPRLDGHLRRLRREHVTLATDIGVLQQDLVAAGDDDALHLTDVRERVVVLLVKLARHRQ